MQFAVEIGYESSGYERSLGRNNEKFNVVSVDIEQRNS